MDVQVLPTPNSRRVIKGFPLEKRKHLRTLDLPRGSQILKVEDQSHEGTLMLWVMLPTNKEPAVVLRHYLMVTYEGEEFDLPEGLESQEAHYVGMWVDRCMHEGDLISVTGHVLEVSPG